MTMSCRSPILQAVLSSELCSEDCGRFLSFHELPKPVEGKSGQVCVDTAEIPRCCCRGEVRRRLISLVGTAFMLAFIA